MTELTYLLSILSRIPEMLGEGIMFGSGVVPTAVQSALNVGWDHGCPVSTRGRLGPPLSSQHSR